MTSRARSRLRAYVSTGVLVVGLAVNAHTVVAEPVDPQACADAKDLRQYLIDNPYIQDAGLQEHVDLRAEYDTIIALTCASGVATRRTPSHR